MAKNELKNYLADAICLLKVPGIGRNRYQKLVKEFGSPASALNARLSDYESVPGITRKLGSQIKEKADIQAARETAARIIQLGWDVLFEHDDEYPQQLKNIKDNPPLLFRIGHPTSQDEKIIGIVGTRNASEKGKVTAYNLAKKLAQDKISVVSGLAEGVDAKAHWGALDGNGKTIAVLGSALDVIYPPSNRSLFEKIKEKGAIYSEYFPGEGPHRAFFPERNRIISGLSVGIVVVEAGEKSGALITAAHALEQNRELFSVPGSISDKFAVGTNKLIKTGARLLTDIEDIYETLPSIKGKLKIKQFANEPDFTDTEKKILSLFEIEPIQVDQISRSTNLPVEEILEFLLALELKGIIKEVSGKRFILAE